MNGSLLILGIELYNIKIQRAGQIMPEVRTELLPAADLERSTSRQKADSNPDNE
jgi:hypothetical protein